jgi:hypothetical protein
MMNRRMRWFFEGSYSFSLEALRCSLALRQAGERLPSSVRFAPTLRVRIAKTKAETAARLRAAGG